MADERSAGNPPVTPNTLGGQPVAPNTLRGAVEARWPAQPLTDPSLTDPSVTPPPADVVGAAAAAPARPSSLGGLVRRFWWLILIVAVGAGGVFLRDYTSGSAGDLRVGDCFDEPPSAQTQVADVQHHPCGDAHTGEVLAIFTYDAPSGAAVPSTDAFDSFVGAHCVPAFEAYVGRSFEAATDVDMGYFYPSLSGWQHGDREVTCYLSAANGQPTRGSLRAQAP
jgi:Septum formation